MYGIFFDNTTKEKTSDTYVAYSWLCGADLMEKDKEFKGDRYKRLEALKDYIKNSVITDSRISVEEVFDKTLDNLLKRDYDEDKAMNSDSGYVKSIESFIHDTAKYTFLDILENEKKEHGEPMTHMEDVVNNNSGNASKDGENRTVGESIKDERAQEQFEMMQDIDLEQAINNMLKIEFTVCRGFITLYMCQALCDDAKQVVDCQKQACKMAGIKTDITDRMIHSEAMRETTKDLAKFKSEDVISEICRTVPSGEDMVELIVEIIKSSKEESTNKKCEVA